MLTATGKRFETQCLAKGHDGLMASRIFITPLGLLWVETSALGITRSGFDLNRPVFNQGGANSDWLEAASSELAEYFAGRRECFTVPVDLRGLAPLARRIYEQVAQIPYGKTKSYGQIGLETGLPARAVGALLRQCPVVLFIPTHRVIHADGRVGGFAGQSWLKAKLLDLEGALAGSG